MSAKNLLSTEFVPLRFEVLASKPIPATQVAAKLSSFLITTHDDDHQPTGVGHASADVTHQLTQLQASIGWLVESEVENSLTAAAGVGSDEVAVGNSAASASKPKGKKKKGQGSKW
ncbi:hypothetical protein HK097_008880 [Rhizophlyctis rosea]|uniref:Uncharacterized protein n=1 Tax=Rhizophlyctis rosea TaxID=64517 RepID=A0AAD5X966_9FUNG|nr:hypothetical protein HK097_008880 [Rhizophlyctis rosea]